MRVDIKQYPDGSTIELLDDFDFVFYDDFGAHSCRVPSGYRSDGASVPRFLWRLLSPCIDPLTLPWSVIHDYLYDHPGSFSRRSIDRFYALSLAMAGYPVWKAVLTWIGVRIGGWISWRNCRSTV